MARVVRHMRALCAGILVPVLLMTGFDASGRGLWPAPPLSRRDLVRIVPECAHPGFIRAPQCRKAAEILERSPQEATDIYLENWSHLVATDSPDASRESKEREHCCYYRDFDDTGSCGGSSGDAIAGAVAVVATVVVVVGGVYLVKALRRAHRDACIRAADRITTRALLAVYERNAGDPFADAMRDALGNSDYRTNGFWLSVTDAGHSVPSAR